VFYEDTQKKLTLLDHRYFSDPIEASDFVSQLNETPRSVYREMGFTRWPHFSFLSSRDIKTRPAYLQAFRDYYGDPGLMFQKNTEGKVVGFRPVGLPPDIDLRFADLGRIADYYDAPFVPVARLTPRLKRKAS